MENKTRAGDFCRRCKIAKVEGNGMLALGTARRASCEYAETKGVLRGVEQKYNESLLISEK